VVESTLLVFAKSPVPGQVKTRLIPVLGPDRAAALHRQLLWYSLVVAKQSIIDKVELWCFPTSNHPFFVNCQKHYAVSLYIQRGKDLGERMEYAFKNALSRSRFALLIGSDCPSLSAQDLNFACQALAQGYNAVLGPAHDGGYVLIGLRRSESLLFSGIPWGSETMLELTRVRMRQLGWQWYELPERWDVDRPDDLGRLREIPSLAQDLFL